MNIAVAHPQANGLVDKMPSRSLMEGIKTRLKREKARWVDELQNGSETVIPAEIGIHTYRTLMIREDYNEEEMAFESDLYFKKGEKQLL
ncbi:hypothetical protein Tco_0734084 [Tanacetum coccineum]